MAEQYTERPTEIEVFPLGSETDVILRKASPNRKQLAKTATSPPAGSARNAKFACPAP